MPELHPKEAVLVALACALALVSVASRAFGPSGPPVVVGTPTELPQLPQSQPQALPPVAFTGPVPLNLATQEELERLPGIGPKLAERIVRDRALGGPYARLEDLQRVKGVGPKLIERIRPYVRVP